MYSECRHIMPRGSKCHSPALRGEPYCYYHVKLHRFSDTPTPQAMTVFSIEDMRGIQLALTQVLTALNSPYMDTRRAGLMLYGLQIAAQLVRRNPGDKPDETVRVCEETNGVSLAPPKEVCEPATDCAPCPRRQTCPDYKAPKEEKREEEREPRDQEEEKREEEREDRESGDLTSEIWESAAPHPEETWETNTVTPSVFEGARRGELSGPRDIGDPT